jgi:hypothetical protein
MDELLVGLGDAESGRQSEEVRPQLGLPLWVWLWVCVFEAEDEGDLELEEDDEEL